MKAQGLGASEIAKALKIGRVLVYRVLIKTHGRGALWSKEIWLSECSTRLWPASALSGRGPAAVSCHSRLPGTQKRLTFGLRWLHPVDAG
jgi:hypothetical protein